MINEQSNERTIERNYALKLNFGLNIPQKRELCCTNNT